MAGTTTKRITVYINGKEIRNNLKDIQAEMVKVRNELRKCTIGTEEYEEKAKRLRQLKRVLDEHQNDLKGVEKGWRDIVHTLGDVGNIMSGIRSFGYILSGFANSIVQTTQEMTKLDDIYGKVRKTTGMTAEEVDILNEAFKKMDTRTSREQLNELAYQAGKLGINGVKNVEQFVKASDQINVALGDVLGDDAMITIGKLSGVYDKVTSQLDGLDLEHKMLRMGDAVNQLGKSSTANEQYIVDFTARLAGVATQAGLSADQIMGFASALDQDMQRVEMSATAFQKLIVQVFRKPEQFARMAGKSVKEFSDLVKTDMNGALMLLLQNMKSNDGLEALIPFLDDVKLAGQRATTVIADMANNLSKVKETQSIANEQLQEGGSMLYEYQKMNETAQAKMEKLKKEIVNVKEALGKELYPIAIELVNLGGVGLKGLTGLVQLVKQFWPVLAVTAGYYATLGALQLKRIAQTQIENTLKKVRLVFDQKEIQQRKIAEAQRATEMRQRYELIAAEQSDIVTKNTEEAVRLKLKASMYAEEIATNKLTIAKLREQAATAKGARHSQLMREIRVLETRSITAQSMSEQYLTRAKAMESAATVASTRASKYAKAAKTAETVATNAHTAAVKAEKAAMATTPWGLALAGVTALTAGIVALVRARKRHIEAIGEELKAMQYMSKEELIAERERINMELQKAKVEREKGRKLIQSGTEQLNLSVQTEGQKKFDKANEKIGELNAQLMIANEQIGKLNAQEIELGNIGSNIDTGNPYTPSGKDDKSDPWASLVERVTSYVEKANTKVKDGLAETMSAVTDEYNKLVRAIDNANTATMPAGVTKEGLKEQLKDAKAIMQQAKLDDYLKKVNTQLEGFQKGLKEVDDNEYLQKIARAQEEYNKKLKDFQDAMLVLKKSKLTVGLTLDQQQAIVDKVNELQELIDKLESIGISATTNTIKANDVRMVKRSSRLGGLETIRQKYNDTVEDATNKRDEALEDAYKRLVAANAVDDYDSEEKIIEEIKILNDNLETTKKNAEDLMKVEVWDHWISQIEQFSNAILDIFGNISTLLSNMEETELQKEEKRRDDSLAQLEKQYEAGTLSKEQYEKRKNVIEETYSKKHDEIQLKQWKREKALNIAQASIDGIVAVLKTYKSYGGWTPAAIAMAALMSASSAAQIAAIAATPKPYAKGGYANEKTIMVGEAGGEWVASNKLLSDRSTAPMIAALDAYQKGDRTALQRVGMATPAWGDVRRASERIGGKRDEDSIAELVRLMKSGGINAVISRRYMEDYEKNENFLRSRSRW